jgi:hypothetical protein
VDDNKDADEEDGGPDANKESLKVTSCEQSDESYTVLLEKGSSSSSSPSVRSRTEDVKELEESGKEELGFLEVEDQRFDLINDDTDCGVTSPCLPPPFMPFSG